MEPDPPLVQLSCATSCILLADRLASNRLDFDLSSTPLAFPPLENAATAQDAFNRLGFLEQKNIRRSTKAASSPCRLLVSGSNQISSPSRQTVDKTIIPHATLHLLN